MMCVSLAITILLYFVPPAGHSRGNSSEEAPPTGSGYATIGSHVQPSGGYPSQYAQPVAAPVGPVVTDPRESVPHYEYDSQY